MTFRYSRQEVLPEIGIIGQERLRNSRVLVIGAGGLGCPILQYLAAAGVGTITVMDDDTVCESNLQRQTIFDTADQGEAKVKVVERRLAALNPEVRIVPIDERFTVETAQRLLSDHDLVLDGSDNFGTTYLVNDACVEAGVPFVFGSIFQFEGQLSICNVRGGPTYRCLYPEPPAQDTRPDCSIAGVVGSVTGVVGCLMAQEAIKYITGAGTLLSGRLLLCDLLQSSFKVISFQKEQARIAAKLQPQHYYDTLNGCGLASEITFEELQRLRSREHITVIDVREQNEREMHHIGGIHIPLTELVAKASSIPLSSKVVVYCKSGYRSSRAVELLKSIPGMADVELLSLQGGIDSVK